MQEMPVTSADGHLFCVRLLTQSDRRAPLVVICPAMGVRGKFYTPLAEALHHAGLQAASFDSRGQGSSSLRASRRIDWGYDDLLTQDYPALLAAVRRELPGAPVFFWGHSQGGQLACLYLARHPDAARGIVLTASGTVYHRGWPFPQSLKILTQTQLLRSISLALGYWPGDKLGFASRQARREIGDWADCALSGHYRLQGAIQDDDAKLEKLTTPVWAFSLAGDDFAPFGCTTHLLEKMPGAKRLHRHLDGNSLPSDCLHHFNWAKNPQALVELALPLLTSAA